METLLIDFISSYGVPISLLALSGIVILGILKFFRIFDKIKKENRQPFYAATSTVLSVVAIIVYLAITNALTVTGIIIIAPLIYLLNQGAYAFYETYGLRKGLKKFGNLIVDLIAKGRIEKAKEEQSKTPEVVAEAQ